MGQEVLPLPMGGVKIPAVRMLLIVIGGVEHLPSWFEVLVKSSQSSTTIGSEEEILDLADSVEAPLWRFPPSAVGVLLPVSDDAVP